MLSTNCRSLTDCYIFLIVDHSISNSRSGKLNSFQRKGLIHWRHQFNQIGWNDIFPGRNYRSAGVRCLLHKWGVNLVASVESVFRWYLQIACICRVSRWWTITSKSCIIVQHVSTLFCTIPKWQLYSAPSNIRQCLTSKYVLIAENAKHISRPRFFPFQ